MWTHTYSKTFKNVKTETIWRLWTDVNNWPTWQEDLEYCKLKGAFAVGNHFMLKPKGVKAVKIELTEIEDERKFTDCTTFFGAKMYDIHELEETKEGLCLTSTLKVMGPLRWLWIKLVAQNVANSASQQMEALVEWARSHDI
jgi:hypothetical protein